MASNMDRYKNDTLSVEAEKMKEVSEIISSYNKKKDAQDENQTTKKIEQITGTKISTAVGTKASVKSMRLDNNLIEAVLYLVNYERLFGKNPKANENQVFASAIKEYVEQPENAKKINKMKRFQEDN